MYCLTFRLEKTNLMYKLITITFANTGIYNGRNMSQHQRVFGH